MKCELCGSERQNSLLYGEFLTKNRKGVHTHCLYLSSGLKQNGDEDEGILGFLLSDIAEERKRVATIHCCYCGKKSANIGCCEKRCHRNFHMICGIECGAMNQFLCTFRSFCDRHVRKIPQRPKPSDNCFICYESIFSESKKFKAVKMIHAPCCKNGWFHKYCLQKFAKSAGYFFKCPLCNDCDRFKTHMSLWGVFAYDKDAEWELVPNAFAELLERPKVCDAEICRNSRGREHQSDSNPLIYCTTCGSVAIHRNCVAQRGIAFECENCKEMLNTDSGRESLNSQPAANDESLQIVEGDENADIDVCGDSDEEVNNKSYDDDADENIIRMNSRRKPALQIMDDEESANLDDGEDEDILVNNRRRAAFQIMDDETESASEVDDDEEAKELVFTSNNKCEGKMLRQANPRNFSNGNDNTALNCSKTEYLSCSEPECHYSVDEGLVDTFYKSRNSEDVKQHDRDYKAVIVEMPIEGAQNSAHNVSCIAQRTRRKSLAVRSSLLNEQENNCSEDAGDEASFIEAYQPGKTYNFFEYDDDSEDSEQPSVETEDEETAESSSTNDIYVNDGDDEAESEYKNESERQIIAQKVQADAAVNHKDAFVNNINRATNPLDISCIANRTRRRSSIKQRDLLTMHPANNNPRMHADHSSPPISHQLTQNCAMFRYEEINEGLENESERHRAIVKDHSSDLKNNEEQGLMDYFYHLLSEVKNGTNVSRRRENLRMQDPLNISCIANRTRRRSLHTNIIDNINEKETEFEANENTSSRSTQQRQRSSSDVTNSTTEWANITTSTSNLKNTCGSTTDSYISSKYFDINVESENETRGISNDEACANSIVRKIEPLAQKRKCDFDTNKPVKIPAAFNELSGTDIDTKNVLDLSCIANRTRRKSMDINKLKQFASEIEEKHRPNIQNDVPVTPQTFTSIVTISLIDSSPESTSSDILMITDDAASTQGNAFASSDIPTAVSAITPTTPATPVRLFSNNIFSSSLSPSSALNIRRGQRIRTRPRRFLDIDVDACQYAKRNLGHSPTVTLANWSNLKEKEDVYVMPRYVRVNGKLKRVSNEISGQQQQQLQQERLSSTYSAQTHFARSYNLLLHSTSENRHASSSRT